ncbi:MAG TPA: hypothetical protein VM118_06430 [Acidobacteriota bacterium]|nr:hypothetical protein [Acidobacteriota bacterium]
MAVRSQVKAIAELERTAGKRVAGIATRYRADTIGPLVKAIKGARGEKEALKRLGPALLKAMDATALAEAAHADMVQAKLIGRVSAKPKGKKDEFRIQHSQFSIGATRL